MLRSLCSLIAFVPLLVSAQVDNTQYSARVVTSVTKSEGPTWRTWRGTLCSMNYPGSWSVDNSGITGTMVSFLAPADSTRMLREHVEVTSTERPGLTLAELAEEHAQEVRRGNAGAEITENTVDGDVQTLLYTAQLNGEPVQCKRSIVKHGDTVLMITYVAAPERYEEELFRADAVVNSVHFLK